jgi:ribosome-binding protein aMBF1 (putative translation factor)
MMVFAPQAREPQDASVPVDFQRWLRAELARRGLSQEQMARDLGISVGTVSRWARGATTPSYGDLDRIWSIWHALPWCRKQP